MLQKSNTTVDLLQKPCSYMTVSEILIRDRVISVCVMSVTTEVTC